MPRTTKAALIDRIAESGLSRPQAERVYQSIVDNISDALARGEDVTIRNFGTFAPRRRPFHWRQLPGTDGEIVRVPERTLVAFRPSAHLRRASDASPDDAYFDAIIARRSRNSRQLLSKPETDLNVPVYDTQFDLGIAYREMGLTKKAAARFAAALRLIGESERGSRFTQCCYMLGLCLGDAGDHAEAAKWFQRGLGAPRRAQAERLEFRYQLGLAHKRAGRVRDALNELLQVFLTNPGFRQVAEHVRALKDLRRAQVGAGPVPVAKSR